MTPLEFKQQRKEMGLSQIEMARFLGYTGINSDRTVRKWEAGDRELPPPVIQIMNWLKSGELKV